MICWQKTAYLLTNKTKKIYACTYQFLTQNKIHYTTRKFKIQQEKREILS